MDNLEIPKSVLDIEAEIGSEEKQPQSDIALIRTSDRICFKRCRRKWNFSSHLREHLEPATSPGPLWMGSGFHYAMEDYHSIQRYGTPQEAFKAYCIATKRNSRIHQPEDVTELTELCLSMLDYYTHWLQSRDPLKTFVYNGVPQVEVTFEVPLPIDGAVRLDGAPYRAVHYGGSIDRVVIDEDNRLWLIDYKSAKTFGTLHFETDPQVTAYCWVAASLYPGYEIAGFIYQQHLKEIAEGPAILKNGTVSVNKQQRVTHRLYRDALLGLYGEVAKSPAANVEFLNNLASQETAESDRFIRRDRIERSQQQIEAEGAKIILEACDMTDINLPLYPNPTRDCAWDCPFQNACILWDCGDDYKAELANSCIKRAAQNDSWRKYLP